MSISLKKEELADNLKALGIVEGDHLALGISLKSLGLGEQAAEILFSSLQSVVGLRGTLVVPAFTKSCRYSEWRLKGAPVFNSETSAAYTLSLIHI